jgi:hypothetical protein
MHAPRKDSFERVSTLIVDAPQTMTLLGCQLLNIDHGLRKKYPITLDTDGQAVQVTGETGDRSMSKNNRLDSASTVAVSFRSRDCSVTETKLYRAAGVALTAIVL